MDRHMHHHNFPMLRSLKNLIHKPRLLIRNHTHHLSPVFQQANMLHLNLNIHLPSNSANSLLRHLGISHLQQLSIMVLRLALQDHRRDRSTHTNPLLLLVLLKQARYQLVLHLFHLHPACPKDPLSAHLLFLLTKCNRCIKVNNQVLSLGKDLLSRTKVVGQAAMDGMVQEIKIQLCNQLILILLVQLRLTALGLEMVLRRGKLTTLMS